MREAVIDIFAGLPGRVHDASISRASRFYNEWQEKMGGGGLLKDDSCSGQVFPFLVTTKRNNGTLTQAEHQQNMKISQAEPF